MKTYRKSELLWGACPTALAVVLAFVVVGIAHTVSAAPIFTETVDVYTVLDNSYTTAAWTHTFDGSVNPITSATLTIVAEGVDGSGEEGENDKVWFEGHFLGYLQQQTFYNAGFDIKPGPGALGSPLTELTTTVFNLDPSWIAGLTSASIEVEANWIMEVETSTLTVIPEPASLSLIGLVTGGIYFARRFFVV